MSQANVDLVRRAYEVAYVARSVEAVRAVATADFVFHGRPEFPGRQVYRLEEMPQIWADLDETYSQYSLIPQDFTPIGDEHVLVTVRTSACLRGSDLRMDASQFHMWRMQGGKLSEVWACNTREEGLIAAGLGK